MAVYTRLGLALLLAIILISQVYAVTLVSVDSNSSSDANAPVIYTNSNIADANMADTNNSLDLNVPLVNNNTPIVDANTKTIDLNNPVVDTNSIVIDANVPTVDNNIVLIDNNTPLIDSNSLIVPKTPLVSKLAVTNIAIGYIAILVMAFFTGYLLEAKGEHSKKIYSQIFSTKK